MLFKLDIQAALALLDGIDAGGDFIWIQHCLGGLNARNKPFAMGDAVFKLPNWRRFGGVWLARIVGALVQREFKFLPLIDLHNGALRLTFQVIGLALKVQILEASDRFFHAVAEIRDLGGGIAALFLNPIGNPRRNHFR